MIHEESNAQPINIGGVMAVPTRSLWQTDSVSLRLRWPLSWGLRAAGTVAWLEAATW